MTNDPRRITLICRGGSAPARSWNVGPETLTRNIVLQTFPLLHHALRNGINELQKDVERVVIDHAATAAGFLDFLTCVPEGFAGDILFLDGRDKAYLSATGRGGDRVLYALQREDVEFYLATHDLTRTYAIPERRTA